jgi:conjugal transfer pilus assembly protein TraW
VIASEHLGPTAPIIEVDLRDAIMKTLKQKEASGEIARLQKEAAERGRRSIEEPNPVEGLKRTETPRTFYLDPTFTQPTTIKDHLGRVIAAAGTIVNPLEYVTLRTRMLFFDGRDPAQVKTAFSLIENDREGLKPVLVGGKYIELMRNRKVRLYFDQGGSLVRRFGIKQVPAIVSQEGYRMRVDEIRVTP